ncbi:MAG: hypothetical protein A4E45_00053 [Methanosaeta sp. PtaB.Bin039]|nr:MAG: hypothetical protein A4E45_00053 [Methanosaeta sp. PtaB.Bin039]
MSFIEDLAIQLNTAGVGVYPGTSSTRTIYLGEMPDTPDVVICLYSRPGRPKDLLTDMQWPEVHVETRAATYTAAQSKAEAIDTALHGIHDTALSGHQYIHIRALGVPVFLEKDGRGRNIFYQNFLAVKGA